jgi:hypothetical protein
MIPVRMALNRTLETQRESQKDSCVRRYPIGDLERQIEAFVEHYNHQRYHESLNNVIPADAHYGRAKTIIQQRERIKRQTIEYRRLQHRKLAA